MVFYPEKCPACGYSQISHDFVAESHFCMNKACAYYFVGIPKYESLPKCPNCGGDNIGLDVHSPDLFCEDCSLSFSDIH